MNKEYGVRVLFLVSQTERKTSTQQPYYRVITVLANSWLAWIKYSQPSSLSPRQDPVKMPQSLRPDP